MAHNVGRINMSVDNVSGFGALIELSCAFFFRSNYPGRPAPDGETSNLPIPSGIALRCAPQVHLRMADVLAIPSCFIGGPTSEVGPRFPCKCGPSPIALKRPFQLPRAAIRESGERFLVIQITPQLHDGAGSTAKLVA